MATKAKAAPKRATKRTTKSASTKSTAKSSEEGAPTDEHGGVPVEWVNDPQRVLGADQLEAMKEWEDRGEIEIVGDTLRSHIEFPINFKDVRPETDFEVKITGPISSPYWGTLKSDGWGQAQLIWRTPVGGDFEVTAKGPGIDLSESFSVASYDADAEYRAQRRAGGKGKAKGKAKAVSGSVATVEDPATMGDTSAPEKAEPTEEEANDPAINDPAFAPAEPMPVDGDEPDGKDKTPPDGEEEK